MGFKPASVIVDGPSGYWDLAIAEQVGDSAKGGGWGGVNYGSIMGFWKRDIRFAKQLVEKHGMIVGVAAHLDKDYLEDVTGERDQKGKLVKDRRMVGWKIAIPGQGQKSLLVPFDEVYLLQAMGNGIGTNPNRRLYTFPMDLMGYPLDLKTRKGVKGPLTNPTYESIIKALPEGVDQPRMFAVIGNAGVGKSRLFSTFPRPTLFIDMQGGCEEYRKVEGIRVETPQKLDDVCALLKTLRDRGELP